MAFGTFTLTGHIDVLDGAPAVGPVVIEAIPSVIIDSAGNKLKLGPKNVYLDQVGDFSVSLPTNATTGNSTTIGFRVRTRLKSGLRDLDPVEFYARPIGATVDLSDITTAVVEPIGDTAANRIAAEAAQAAAEAAAAAAEAVGATTDAQMAAVASDEDSDFRAAIDGIFDVTPINDLRDLTDTTFKDNLDEEIAAVATPLIGPAAGSALCVYMITDPAFAGGASPSKTAAQNSAAIQAAADAAYTAGRGVVYVPAGDFSYDTTISVLGIGGGIVGAHRRASKLTYTGSGTAITFKDRATATQKLFPVLREFTLNAASATKGIDAIGSSYGVYEALEIVGKTSPTVPTSGSVGILFDGSLGTSIGCWHNVVDKCYVSGWDVDVKVTGTAGAGQANENRVLNTRLGWHNIGVHIDVGDHCTVQGCDISTSNTGAIGVYVNDVIGRVLDNRFEQVATAVKLGANSDQAAVRGNSFYNGSGNVAIRIESGAKRSRYLGDNSFSTSVTNFSVASTTLDATAANLNFFGSGDLVPMTFRKTAVAAGLTNSALDVEVLGLVRYVGRPYQIRGITARLSSNITAGTITVAPDVGGASGKSTTLSASATSATVMRNFQPMNLDTNSGGSSVGAVVTTTSDFAPAGTADLQVIVWVEFTPT